MDKDNIFQNLKDAGCNNDLIDKFFSLLSSHRNKELMLLLDEHRAMLLENLHLEQKRIDCLDFLIFNLKQNNNKY